MDQQQNLTLHHTMTRVGCSYLALFLLNHIFQLLIILLFPEFSSGTVGMWVLSFVPMYVLAMPVFLLMMHRLIPGKSTVPDAQRLRFSGLCRWLFICFGVLYACNFISVTLTGILSLLRGEPLMNPLSDITEGTHPLLLILFVCILGPLGEEFIFRKILYDKIGCYGTHVYILAGSVLFGLFHSNFFQMYYALALGAIFCYIYAHTGRLRYTVLLHGCINFFGTAAVSWLEKYLGASGEIVLGIFVYLCIGLALFLLLRGRWKFPAAPKADVMTGEAISAPGMAAFITIALAMTMLNTFFS